MGTGSGRSIRTVVGAAVGVMVAATLLGCGAAVETVAGFLPEETPGTPTSTASSSPAPTAAAGGVRSGRVDVFDLQVGHCLRQLPADDGPDTELLDTVTLISCDQPHEGEVFANWELSRDGDYPGDAAVDDEGWQGCEERFADVVGVPYETSYLFIWSIYPSEESWDDGDRMITCVVYDPDGPLTGTAQGLGDAATALGPELPPVGTCLDQEDEQVDCATRHAAEVYAHVELPRAPWPGEAELDRMADRACVEAFSGYVGRPLGSTDLGVWYSTADRAGWEAGDRVVLCTLEDLDGEPLLGSSREPGP